ncbi:hypothetical protein [Pseudoduganella umbonata]|uniref:CBM-cenC domain-containing protein n=1 Tax=Pseudoduganella umbonata TaxID=864828 RepID=A0A4P8HZ65_9BURK|nr:hypothetical protein [Pseudoduganella umbonata]MBB3223369.1 hypothetical protein [Pseudoduganella umbonata]QCP13725.1 hypothetical protein FCL38_27320 [Pseudoduganella umbonata]
MRPFSKKIIAAAVFASLSAGLALPASAADSDCPDCFPKRWIYYGGNVTVPAHVETLKKVIADAAVHGYNGIAVNTSGDGGYHALLKPTAKTALLRKNLAELIALGASQGVELIPVGGGPAVPTLTKPELVEALPATASLTVRQKVATVTNDDNLVRNGNFASGEGWAWDAKWVKLDRDNDHAGDGPPSASMRMAPSNVAPYNSRVYRRFDLAPHKAYRLSFWLKAGPRYPASNLFVQILAEGQNVPVYRNASSNLGWGSKPDGSWNDKGNSDPKMFTAGQDWKKYELEFNTGNASWVTFYLSNQRAGDPSTAAWVDDIELREIGLAHPVRRASLPLVVKGKDGTVYREGGDYVVGPEKLSIPDGSRIRDGQVLDVAWYQSAENLISRWGTPATACAGEFFDIQKAYYDEINKVFGGKFPGSKVDRYFLYYDEIRVMNWDPGCKPKPKTAGEYLARMVNGVGARLTGYRRPVEKLVWNDMFDPTMNAVPRYWQVNGDLSKTSVPLDPSFVIVNWAGGSATSAAEDAGRRVSLKKFADPGHRQVIALYYDNLSSVNNWLSVLGKQLPPGMDGVMYTTWGTGDYAGYAHLGAVAEKIRERLPGRWPAKRR